MKHLIVNLLLQHSYHASMAGSPLVNSDTLIANATAILVQHLQSEWTHLRTPNGFNTAREKAYCSPEDVTARIFLNSSFQAWVAYFLATGTQGRHYAGQSADQKTLMALEALPVEDRKTIAITVTNAAPHPTVRTKLAGLERPEKRRRKSGAKI
jgi:hypothetical protein